MLRCIHRPAGAVLAGLRSGVGSGGSIRETIMRPVIVLPLHAAAPRKALHSILIYLQQPLVYIEMARSASLQAMARCGEA